MKLLDYLKLGFFVLVLAYACSPDDDSGFVATPERDRAEQQIDDLELLQEYMNTHYFNEDELSAIENPTIDDIRISFLAEGETVPQGSTLLSASSLVLEKTTTYEETEYTYYILKINQGGGESPNFTDRVRVTYEGFLVEDNSVVFDRRVTPEDLSLVGVPGSTSAGTIVGWQRVFPEFNTANSFTTGSNVTFDDYGVGVMFLPSGLGYFSRTQPDIPAYSNIIFKFTLLQYQENDHDGDGVPSHLEDLNENLDEFDDDTDEDGAPDYLDADDDNDGVTTLNEDLDEDGNPMNDDTDGDSTPNYRDADDDGDGVDTINEDLDNDGDPTNDDSDGDGIPNYLDPDSTESNES